MKKSFILCLTATLLTCALSVPAQEAPKMPEPVKEHKWLEQLTGEWESETECFIPGAEGVKGKLTESAKMMGGFWLITNGTGEVMEMKMTTLLTLGYDAEKKKYVGTWVDSMTSTLWNYEGTVDASGKKLTLETEGPCPLKGGKTGKFREVVEILDKDHKVFTSSMQGDDGKWVLGMKMTSTRKK